MGQGPSYLEIYGELPRLLQVAVRLVASKWQCSDYVSFIPTEGHPINPSLPLGIVSVIFDKHGYFKAT
jgi:hypothetical protein